MTGILTLVDNSTALELFTRRDRVIESWTVWRFREEFLKNKDLTAVPFEDAWHFTSETAIAIAKASQAAGFQRASVIPLIDEPRCCYQAPLQAEALEALGDVDTIWTYFLVLEENGRFAIICDELFNTIAGSRRFVEDALDSPINSAYRRFVKHFVDDARFPEDEKESFRKLVAFYDKSVATH